MADGAEALGDGPRRGDRFPHGMLHMEEVREEVRRVMRPQMMFYLRQ